MVQIVNRKKLKSTGVGKLSVKSQTVHILGFTGHTALLPLLSSATVVGKQAQTVQMSVAAFVSTKFHLQKQEIG